MKNSLKFFLITIIILWLFGFLYIFSGNTKNSYSEIQNNYDDRIDLVDNEVLRQKIRKAESDLIELQNKNEKNEELIEELKSRAQECKEKFDNFDRKNVNSVQLDSPSYEFEELRRKIFHDVKDVSYYINSQLDWLKNAKNFDNLNKNIDLISQQFKERINVLIASTYNLSISNHLGEWRRTESENLAKVVQKRFTELQNPEDCNNKKKIICDMGKSCGYGCQMHHIMYCFITAYFTNRTMILNSDGWRYNEKGYEAYFMPLSETCRKSNAQQVGWNEHNDEKAPEIKMPIIDAIVNKPSFLPLSVPKEILEPLKKFHGDPFVWWSGQVLSYLMRFNSEFQKTINQHTEAIQFKTPCVGVHVRRTDKIGSEAAYHGIDEYMKYVKEFYDIEDLKNSKKTTRNVFLATDEVGVLKEAKENYKDYKFFVDETNAKTASLNQRYSPESAQGVILDIYHLSQCDYLVCTFSSQVCRMAYELMQVRFPDASWRFKSLDDVYYFGGQNKHDVMAIYDHEPNRENGEIELRKGDLIGLAGNHWNGFSKGQNRRTNEIGLFPTFKTMNVIDYY
ncbi:unnamed protein product [Brachionus calyciflorus]|uniref:Alpha-(1,6)-fucosyltransferase n=1 Tax=Brachionus calyciflorus TaxID=104777 RepID=A0A813MDJ7_9BILA|nr:unnamed protein product [Brachionus calyciflorus]